MRWDFGQLMEGIEEFQRRSQRTQKSLADGSVGGATLLGSPTPAVAGLPGVGLVGPTPSVGPHIAWFNASGGDRTSGRAKYDVVYATVGHDWFDFPGADQTKVEVLEPGMLMATYRWSASGSPAGAVDVAITTDSWSIIASHEAAVVGTVSGGAPMGEGAGAVTPGEKLWVDVSGNGTDDVFGQLMLVFWPGDPWVKVGSTWLWEDTGTYY